MEKDFQGKGLGSSLVKKLKNTPMLLGKFVLTVKTYGGEDYENHIGGPWSFTGR